ncbi:MAG: sulfotransferase [Chloroflexi bacterium]|nr:sulfotransferase [Chloroflexota bacterium]
MSDDQAAPDDPEPRDPTTALGWIGLAQTAGLDPTPTPITLRSLPDLCRRTHKTERISRRTLGRRRRSDPGSLLRSVMPSLDGAVFLVGAPRSGTTFLGDALGHVPEVSYHHEPVATKAAGRYVALGLWSPARSRRFFRMVYRWLLRYGLDGGRWFAEKTPTNAFLVPFLAETFPGSRFIHIIRDGRDAAASHLQKPWHRADSALSGRREPGGYLYGPWAPWWVPVAERAAFESGPDILRMSMSWRLYTEAALQDTSSLGSDRHLELRYEDLVRSPGVVGERILDFLGVERAASRERLRDALATADPGSIGRWRELLDPAAQAVLLQDAGALLRRLGYLDPSTPATGSADDRPADRTPAETAIAAGA